MPRHNTITTIDIGTSKVSCLIGEYNSDSVLEIAGKGQAPSHGITKGAINDVEECSKAIEIAVMEAENAAGIRVSSVTASVSGEYISSGSSKGKVEITSKNGEITQNDISRVIEAARNSKPHEGHRILHVVPRCFSVDSHDAVKNPLGMIGKNLEIDAYLIMGKDSFLQNINQAILRTGLELETSNYVFSSFVSGHSVVDESEKNLGVILIDMGAGTTKINVYKSGVLVHSRVLPLGGDLITYDIAVYYGIPLSEAEKLKIQEGSACADLLTAEEEEAEVEAASFSESQSIVLVKREVLAQIIEARLMDIFEVIRKEISWLHNRGIYIAGSILTGGVAKTRHVHFLAQRILEVPTKVGRPGKYNGLSDWAGNPEFASVVGSMRYLEENKLGVTPTKNSNQLIGYFKKAINWLHEVF
ncbi:MAG: cell division protein FtsA [Vulcanimicrobiota bacterium]